ncbi:MAG: ribonuclease HII [Dehalogenimonas sp.]
MVGATAIPHFREESAFFEQGVTLIAGVDEAGRGALAGPVVAGAVILGRRRRNGWLKTVRDSKLLPVKTRNELYDLITAESIAFGIGIVSHQHIDEHGIISATRLAMKLALSELHPGADGLLIDYLTLPGISLPQKGIVDGDAVCVSIACASIIAKVTRDRLMISLENRYPGYNLSKHKGYGTVEHLECLHKYGPCRIHRRSFAPIQHFRSLL